MTKEKKPTLNEEISDSPYLTVKEVSNFLRISERTIYRLCRDGEIAGARRFGGVWRIHAPTLLKSIREESK